MKKILLVFLLLSSSAFAQEFNFDIHHTSLHQLIKMEEALGGVLIPNTSQHISFTGEAQPISYRRKEKGIPELISYYYFKKKDSTMSYILHEWDVNNFEKKENNQKSPEYQKALIVKYKSLETMITALYGSPEVIGDLTQIGNSNTKEGLKKKDIWHPNDSTEIEMYTAISNFYNQNGMITINPTHRIRLYIRNTKKSEAKSTKLSAKKLDSLNSIVKLFFNELKARNFQGCKAYLSNLIIDKVTDAQLNSLVNAINFDNEVTLYFSGTQVGLDGTAFAVLQYKYANEASNPPKELLKIIFDDKSKIAAVQPIKLNAQVTK